MFDILKKKVTGFTNKIFGKTKKKAEEQEKLEIASDSALEKPIVEEELKDKATETQEKLEKSLKEETKEQDETKEELKKDFKEEPKKTISDINISKQKDDFEKDIKEETSPTEITPKSKEEKPLEKFDDLKESVEVIPDINISKQKDDFEKDIKEETSPTEITPKSKEEKPLEKFDDFKKPIEEPILKKSDLTLEKKTKLKKSVISSIKGIFTEKIKLSEKEINEFLEEFELSLLEADVSIDSANAIIIDLKERLTKESFNKKNILEDIKKRIRESLTNQLDIDCDIDNYSKELGKKTPFVIMFVGPNGAGKTTTIAKFGKRYKDQKLEVIFSSSDTFRAGSIQQLEKHADNLNIKIIKQNYGSDPAAVAYDAVASAKANKSDLVLIDTAGRQETNINLMQELKKIKKVVSPDLVIYIGESQAGQAIVEQISKFKEEIGLDGVILTKLDTDPKGGVAISILNSLKLPVFFIGTGQEYDDLMKFSVKFIVDRVVE